VKEHGRPPAHGEDRDIFERLYAVRLDRLRAEQDFRDLLAPYDDAGLLSGEFAARPAAPEPADDDAVLAELGVGAGDVEGLSTLKHVKPRAEVHAAANRTVCKDFEQFKPLFAQVQKNLEKGLRKTRSFQTMAEIKKKPVFHHWRTKGLYHGDRQRISHGIRPARLPPARYL
jgi:hypothetical protein